MGLGAIDLGANLIMGTAGFRADLAGGALAADLATDRAVDTVVKSGIAPGPIKVLGTTLNVMNHSVDIIIDQNQKNGVNSY